MGTFKLPVSVANPAQRESTAILSDMLVDTGSEYTWITSAVLEQIGIAREKRDLSFVMANGQVITRDTGYVIIQVGDRATVDEVVFARADDQSLLGAHTLETLRILVDAARKRLLSAGAGIAATAVRAGDSIRSTTASATLPPITGAALEGAVVAIGTPTLRMENLVRSRHTGVITTAPLTDGVPLSDAELDALALFPPSPTL